MGFGLLLCGYFVLTLMAFGSGEYAFAAYLIGALVSANAAEKLKSYNPRFGWLTYVSILYGGLSIYGIMCLIDDLFLLNWPIRGEMIGMIVGWVGFITEFLFTLIMLWSVRELSKEVELDNLASRANFNLGLLILWAVGQVVAFLSPAAANAGNQTLTKLVLLFALAGYLLNAFLLHACFKYICPAGEEYGTPVKPSRFKLINKLNEKMEAHSEKAARESQAYYAEKHRKKQERRKKRK